MKCSDVPDIPILEFLSRNPEKWHRWYGGDVFDVSLVMPPGAPDKVKLAKMRRLIARGLVDGCPCGCRGDFQITPKGTAHIKSLAPPVDG